MQEQEPLILLLLSASAAIDPWLMYVVSAALPNDDDLAVELVGDGFDPRLVGN